MRKLDPEFTFAGFTFPRYIPQFVGSTYRKKLQCVYYHAPKLEDAGKGKGFYLEDAGSFERWSWCDEIDGARIDHTGWFCDDSQDQKIRGLVVRLPHNRFLAGWSMGERMASAVEGEVYTDQVEAARAADRLAESVAEREREYQEEEERKRLEEEANQGADEEETEGY